MFYDLYTNHTWFVYTLIGVFSLCIGSLLNVVVYRLPLMMQDQWRQECYVLLDLKDQPKTNKINLFWPRSFCPHCKAKILAWQNIPLLSYLYLKGRCNQCDHPIPRQYPLIELITLLLSVFACWHFGLSKQLMVALPTIWIVIAVFFIDLYHQLIPDSLSLSLLWLGLLANSFQVFTSLENAVYSAAIAYLSLYLLIQIYYLIRGKIAMGNGDFKLFAAFGALLGYPILPLILFIAAAAGSLIGLIQITVFKKNKQEPIPFGPYLCIAGLMGLFWGHEFVAWYVNLVAAG